MHLIQRLPANTTGIDWIVGDLRGMYDHLVTLLAYINFNTDTDRLFLVGDLINRGPKSIECLRLLKEPFVYCAMGNHGKEPRRRLTPPVLCETK